MSTRIRLRYDSIQNWSVINPAPTLLPGEFGVARHPDGTITVRVGNGENNTPVNWGDAEEISGAGTVIDGFDFTNLDPGDIIYWNGNGWDTASLSQRIVGGANIQVTEGEDGIISINYFTATFNPTATLNENKTLIEVRNKYNNSAYNETTNPGGLGTSVNYAINNGGTVTVASGSVIGISSENYSGFGTFDIFAGAGSYSFPFADLESTSEFGALIGTNGFSANSVGERSDYISVSMTPSTTTTSGAPYSGSPVTVNLTFNYGWRRFFVWSQTNYTDATALQAAYQSNPSSFSAPAADAVSQNPDTQTTSTLTSPSGAGIWYLYYMHSSNGTGANDTFDWDPRFLSSTNEIETFTEITTGASGIPYDTVGNTASYNPTKQYRVWKFSNGVNPNTALEFKID